MEYYIFIQDGKTNGAGQCPIINDDVINFRVEKELYDFFVDDPKKFIWDGEQVVPNPNYEEEQAQERQKLFNEQFFNTSLGYVKRTVTMKDGSERNFLTDILPLLQTGIPVITYNFPDFYTDETPTQNRDQMVTETFLQECKQQLLADFYG